MEKKFWDDHYAENSWVYGPEPNRFFRQFIDDHKPGSILLPAEGEGRNAVYAAKKGWKADAFDFSRVAKEKALKLAKENQVSINYWIQDLWSFRAEKQYDAAALIYVHLPDLQRQHFHEQVYKSLVSGGYLVLEAFAREQVKFSSGGPKDPAMLYDAPTICQDFPFLHVIHCGQKEIVLNEGEFHKGKAAVLQLIGQKL